ncbi:MAG TPA: heavy metal translocating P-type ATPase, partial [Candidatus Paceibacterota bacterium]|nr:heavy metal translocating P-type ATPase [Candidatus Paceibacterota bacterium]
MIARAKKIPLPVWVALLDCAVLVAGGVLYFTGHRPAIAPLFKISVFILALPLWYEIIRDMLRRRFGVDLIAGVAILTAFILRDYLPGLVIILMLSGGQTLESYAVGRARSELSRLLQRSPTRATRKEGDKYREVSVDEIVPGDFILVKSGEVIAVDGEVAEGVSLVDESSITGESVPVEKNPGSFVSSGT